MNVFRFSDELMERMKRFYGEDSISYELACQGSPKVVPLALQHIEFCRNECNPYNILDIINAMDEHHAIEEIKEAMSQYVEAQEIWEAIHKEVQDNMNFAVKSVDEKFVHTFDGHSIEKPFFVMPEKERDR